MRGGASTLLMSATASARCSCWLKIFKPDIFYIKYIGTKINRVSPEGSAVNETPQTERGGR
jgi:hypothetical protein